MWWWEKSKIFYVKNGKTNRKTQKKSANVLSSSFQNQKLAYLCYDKVWRRDFVNIFSAEDEMKDINFNQLKLKVKQTYKKKEKITTYCEPSNDGANVNKTYLDTYLKKIGDHITLNI